MIRITRASTYVDKIRAYKIYADDIYLGDIKRNETKEFPIEKGRYSLYAKIDWCRSNKLDIVVSDSVADVEVGPTLTVSKLWLPFVQFAYMTFKRNEYLWIKKKDKAVL